MQNAHRAPEVEITPPFAQRNRQSEREVVTGELLAAGGRR